MKTHVMFMYIFLFVVQTRQSDAIKNPVKKYTGKKNDITVFFPLRAITLQLSACTMMVQDFQMQDL